ncbi:MAG: InlB B-repeat-containing protein, partial [Acutalibacteraceae bacterium]
MKKRILSIVLTICMVLSIVPVTVFAANTDATELENLMAKGGTVKLTRDYTVDSTLDVTKDVTIDLNGYVIRMTDKGSLFHVELAAGTAASATLSLTLKDSNSTRKHTGDNASLPDGGVITTSVTGYRAVYLRFKCRFIMEGGTIYGFNARWGGAVYAEFGCHFFLKNGTISNCSSDFGGAVYLMNNVSHNNVDDYTNRMTMSGGAIRDCVATYAAGGVFCSGNNEFTMAGGVIENCKSLNKTLSHIDINGIAQGVYIGAVYIVKSTFIVNGGIIKDVVFISALTKVENTNSGSVTKFYDNVVSLGTVSGGVYYGGIQNTTASVLINDVWDTYTGTVTGTCYKVSFNLNGAEGSIPTQWFVNTKTATALKITPTREGYEFKGWYNGNTYYIFSNPVTGNLSLTAKWVKNC